MQHYRLHTATLAIMSSDGHQVFVRVPKGASIELVKGSADAESLVDVRWENKIVMMFTADIQERGELATAAEA